MRPDGTGKRLSRRLILAGVAGLVLVAAACSGEEGVEEAAADGSGAIETTQPADRPVQPSALGSGALAYGIDGDIYVADPGGSNAVKIADGRVDSFGACEQGEQRENVAFGTAWSPNGRYLAYWDWGCPVAPPAWGTAVITDPAGNLVASFPGQGWLISWSPDSSRVAIWDVWGETIGVYGLDGARQATLTMSSELMPSGDYTPVWSRDGASLLLPGVQVPLDGSSPRALPRDDLTHHWFAAYSPDGSHVAYVDGGSLVVAETNGSDARAMGGATDFWDAAWSPSGDRVAFIQADTELRVRDIATGSETSLVNVSESERLQVIEFSPDGAQILFSRFEDLRSGVSSLWSIGIDGSDLQRLVATIEWADWRPQISAP
jgi:hypothetical protein